MNFNLLRSFINPFQVSYLILYVTNRCNYRCNFCFYHKEIEKGYKADELTLEEFKKISKKIGPLIQLSLAGGEPFLRHDLAEITGYFIKNTSVRYITIPTNGSLPNNLMEYLEKVLPRYPDTFFRIVFSIDGIGEAHDRTRSAPGAYEALKKSYQLAVSLRGKYKNLVLDSNSIFTSETEDALLETLRNINQDFKFDNLSVTYVRGDVKDSSLKKVSLEKYIVANDYLSNIKRTKESRFLYPFWRAARDLSREFLVRIENSNEFITPCMAGKKLLVIWESGDVAACEVLKDNFGNLRDHNYDIKKILTGKKAREVIGWINKSKCRCSFECALAANAIWGKSSFLKLLRSILKNIGK